MWREVAGGLAGAGVFAAGFYTWFHYRDQMPAPLALRRAFKLGLVYWVTTTLLDRLIPGR